MENTTAAEPATDVKAAWAPCSPQTIAAGGWGGFSAAAYYFGRHLHKELNVPIGLIDTTVGGTAAESWTSRKTLEANPVLKPLAQGGSSSLYNGQVAPLMPYAIRGAIWYQGESNLDRAFQYRTLFPAMIANWRADWGQGDFPFGFVQLAPFRYGQNLAIESNPRSREMYGRFGIPSLWVNSSGTSLRNELRLLRVLPC